MRPTTEAQLAAAKRRPEAGDPKAAAAGCLILFGSALGLLVLAAAAMVVVGLGRWAF